MPVYVDDMEAPFGRMLMSHMIADTSAELLAMADKIGVARKWIQYPDTAREHFDIAQSKKAMAIKFGAVPVTWRQVGAMELRRRKTGSLGDPSDAEEWLKDYYRARGLDV